MTAEAFLDEDTLDAEAFLDEATPTPATTAEAFLDMPEESPAERPTGTLLLTPEPTTPDRFAASSDNTVPQPAPPIDLGQQQADSIARDAIADTNARRGIFSPDSEPFRIVGESIAVDPARYDDAAGALWKDGLIGSDEYFRMMNDAEDVKSLWQARRELEQTAGTNPELKAALYGFGKGGAQLASAIAVGGTTGTALAPTGPVGAIGGGIAAGTATSMLVGDMFDTFAEKLAETDATAASFLAARQLAPGYDTAGQFASILIPSPLAISRLSTATRLIATERGAAEAAKFAGKVTLAGAGIGAATDAAIQGIGGGLSLSQGQAPEFNQESLGISTALGALTAGMGVKSRNRVYFKEELPVLEQKVKLGIAAPDEAADYFSMRRSVEILREDQRLVEAGAVARSTVDFMGTRALDVNTIINPRFQQSVLTDAGFTPQPPPPGPSLAYATESPAAPVPVTGQPPAYTGQTFIDRGGPAPAFQGGTQTLPGPEGIPALGDSPTILPSPAPAPVVSLNETPPPPPAPPRPASRVVDIDPIDIPLSQLKLSTDVPNFKEGADPETGVVEGEELKGKVDKIGLAPIQVWQRLNGDLEIISGRHRFDLFRRNNEPTIKAQVFKEAEGFSLQDALTLDAEMNIKDEKGTVKDYANYFRNSQIGAEEALQRGLLSRQKGISGFAIGKSGSDDLYATFAAGRISESKAAAIATAAPLDADLQRLGLRFAGQMSAPELTSLIRIARQPVGPTAKQGDLFGNSDENLNTAVALVKASQKRVKEIDDQILSVKGAVNRPEAARKMGVDIKDPAGIKARIADLQTLKAKYDRFFEHPEILAEVRAIAFGEQPVASTPTPSSAKPAAPKQEQANLISNAEMPFNLVSDAPEPPKTPAPTAEEEEAARRAAIRKAGEENTGSLFDQGPSKPRRSGGKTMADAGPQTRPAAPPPSRPDLNTYSDAQVYADYPDAVGVLRTKGPGWTMPLILGGTDKVLPIEMPELVELVRSFTGNNPKLKRLPRSLGLFSHDGTLTLRPDLFANEQSAMMTFAHELGHMVGWMDDRNLKLGNLGGHIMNVQNFLKHAFPIEKGGQLITPKERKQLRAQAKSSMPAGSMPMKDDPGRADWEAEVATRYRELIQELMAERNLAYVGNRRGTFEDGAYDPNIREELIALSEWWKPIDYDAAPESYLNYRHSAVELYADAMSVLLNSPADLETRAPIFWQTFWNYLDARPQVKASLFEIQNRIHAGRDAILDKRLARDLEAFQTGRETFVRKHNAAQERRTSLNGWWENLKDQYWNRYQPLLEATAKARAAGKITPAEEDAYRWLTEEHPLADSKLQLKLADIGRIYQGVDAAGINRDYIGAWLKFHRAANERLDVTEMVNGEMVKTGETGRAVMANPGGETARTSAEMLDKIRRDLGPEKTAALESAIAAFRQIVFDVVTDGYESGLYSPELYDLMSRNKDNYATFTPLEYVENYLPAGIRKQIGTFKDIADPFQQTVLKMIAMHRAAQNNRFKRGVVQALRQTAPEIITDAPLKYNGTAMVPEPPRDQELSLVDWKDGGKLQGVHLPKRYARMWDDQSPAERDAILRLLSTGFQNLVYGAIIRYNPAFQLFMSPARDLQRSLTNMPGGIKGRARFLANFLNPETWGASIEWARGDIGRSALLREMIENAAVGGPHTAFGGAMQADDDALVSIFRKFHLQDQPSRNALIRALMAPLKAIEFAGQVLQLLPKAAAYKVMVKDLGMPAPQTANTIRNHIGIPNYYKKGRHAQAAGALVPFLNIFLRSYESLYRNLSGKERNMGGKEWWIAWLLTGGGLYAVLQTLAREGVFGEDLQRLYSRVPDWDMTNFGIIPIGETGTGDTGGKTVYLRLPQDEGLRVINGVVSKLITSAIRTGQGNPTAPAIGEIFSGISSQVPGENPLLEVGKNWTTYLAGRNPRDNFRNRYILSEDQWIAGGWESAKPMLAWTLGTTGITNFFSYDPQADNLTELTISATPVLNRFLKITDRGIYQNDLEAQRAEERPMAKLRLSLPDYVNGLRTEYNYLRGKGDLRTPKQDMRYMELGIWRSQYDFAMGEVETSMELGNRAAAQAAIQQLIRESQMFRPR